jgi:hypothetical protein
MTKPSQVPCPNIRTEEDESNSAGPALKSISLATSIAGYELNPFSTHAGYPLPASHPVPPIYISQRVGIIHPSPMHNYSLNSIRLMVYSYEGWIFEKNR